MNTKMKRRMIVVGGVIVIVVILLLAVVGGSSNARVVSVGEAASDIQSGTKVQVTGVVVDNSFAVDQSGVLTFDIQEENASAGAPTLHVSYDKGVSATFGNGVTAICTGRIDDQRTLVCTELVTKCPSKYENSSSALTVEQLLGYDSSTMVGKTVKVVGAIQKDSLSDATAQYRFVLESADAGALLPVMYQGSLPDGVSEGASVVVTGSLSDAQELQATDVAMEG